MNLPTSVEGRGNAEIVLKQLPERSVVRYLAVMWLLAILIPFPSQALAQGPPGLDSTVAHIVDAPANTVWLVHPDMNASHPKPQGVSYPDLDSYGLYALSMGVIQGMQAHQQLESVDTNTALFNATTGKPVLSGATFVFMAPPSVEAQMAFYESNRIARVYLSGNESSLFWVSGNGTIIRETVTSRSALTGPTDLFLLEVFSDPNGNYVFAGYGLTAKGTMAAAHFYKAIFPQLETYTEGWYIERWVDVNDNGIPDSNDSYILVASDGRYPIPEFWPTVASVTLLLAVAAVLLVPKVFELRGHEHARQVPMSDQF